MLRLLSGFAIAGAYTVIESWLQAKLNNSNRGRVFSVYRVADMSGILLAQSIVAALDPATYIAYNFIAMIACMSLLPLALTQSMPPELLNVSRSNLSLPWQSHPLRVLGFLPRG